jgi:ubiquinone/menaquinone biosynthesis C-methylase UbiE
MTEGVLAYCEMLSGVFVGFILPVILNNKVDQSLLSGPKSAAELCVGTDLNPNRLHRYLLLLEANGMFSYDSETKKWSHNRTSMFYADPALNGLTRWALDRVNLEGFFWLDGVLKSEQSMWEARGMPQLFDVLRANSGMMAYFQSGMEFSTGIEVQGTVEQLRLDGINSLLDVAGGNGSLVIALTKKYPNKRFCVFDQPQTKPIADQRISEHGLSEKITAYAGSFFDSIPSGFDAITIKNALHNWRDDDAIKILRTIRAALEPGKKLIIIEYLTMRGKKTTKAFAAIDIYLLGISNGGERTEEEFEYLLNQSGFMVVRAYECGSQVALEAVAYKLG